MWLTNGTRTFQIDGGDELEARLREEGWVECDAPPIPAPVEDAPAPVVVEMAPAAVEAAPAAVDAAQPAVAMSTPPAETAPSTPDAAPSTPDAAPDMQTLEDGLEDLTIAELRAIANAHEIALKSELKKADILDFLRSRGVSALAAKGAG